MIPDLDLVALHQALRDIPTEKLSDHDLIKIVFDISYWFFVECPR